MFRKTRICKSLMFAFGSSLVVGGWPAAVSAQRVEITGSSIKRVEAEGALQVQTLNRADIERTGVQTTEQLLQTVSAMSSSGQTNTAMGAGLGTYGGSGVSLRGLGEERTLVLLNGRRLAAFSGSGGGTVNVNNIPLAAVERVEILKDGASAVYGSDAVAGVVNFILTKDFQGYQLGGTVGTPTTGGGGQQYQANIVAGWGDLNKENWNLTVSGQWLRNQDLFGRDRSYASSGDRYPLQLPLNTGQGNIQGAWTLGSGPKNVAGAPYQAGFANYGNPLASAGQCGTLKGASRGSDLFNGYPWCTYDQAADVGLLSQTETVSGTMNFVFRLNDSAELFADGLYSRSVITTTYQPSPVRTSFMETSEAFATAGIDRVLLLRPSNPAYSLASSYLQSVGLGALDGEDLGITSRAWDFGPRVDENTSTQTRLVAGARGDWMEQSYNVALGYNESKLGAKVKDGYFAMTSFAAATQAAGSDWNPWSPTQSPAFMNALAPGRYVGKTLDAKTSATNLDATLSGDVLKLPSGMMQYAAGYQYRRENFSQSPSAALGSGDIAGLGGAEKPIDADRNVNALFGELNIPIVKSLDGGLALRWDDYSDFGSTTNWKGNLRWQPSQQWLVRGSYGTGFRAPTLKDLYAPQVLQSSSQFNDPVTGQQNLQVNDLTGGNPNLKPETSKQWSAGLVFQPVQQVAIGLDYFSIQVDNVISAPSTQEIVTQNALGNPAYAGLVVRNPLTNNIESTKTLLANTGTMTVQGMDLDFRYREKLGPGVINVGLNSTYYFKFDQSTPGGGSRKVATVVNPDGSPVISSTIDRDGYGVVLRYKQYLSGTWTQGDWSTTLANQYATGYHAGWDFEGNPTTMPSLSLWDLQVAYTGFKNAVITLGGRNIFDKQPAFYVYSSNQFQVGYDPSQYDPRGRFIYLTGTLKF